MRRVSGVVGAVILGVLLLLAVLGPFIAPHSPTETLGIPFSPPGPDYPLGLDAVGRDVLTRVLYGGSSVLMQAVGVTLAAYLIAVPIGLYAAYRGGFAESVSSWFSDLMLSFPPVLLLLLFAAISGPSIWVAMLAVLIGHIPMIIRITRAAAAGTVKLSFVEAARLRGESAPSILLREVLPNTGSTLLADLGTRLAVSILVISAAGFLGLGQAPPTPDWGLMVSENQRGLTIQPLGVFAPAAMIALFIISFNLLADSLLARPGDPRPARRRRSREALA